MIDRTSRALRDGKAAIPRRVERREVGARIQELVKIHFKTKKQAAEELGTSPTTLDRYYKGTSVIDLEVAAALADKTGRSIHWIVYGVKETGGATSTMELEKAVEESAEIILKAAPYLDEERSATQLASAIAKRVVAIFS